MKEEFTECPECKARFGGKDGGRWPLEEGDKCPGCGLILGMIPEKIKRLRSKCVSNSEVRRLNVQMGRPINEGIGWDPETDDLLAHPDLEEEGGVTEVSLRNIEKIITGHGPVRIIIHRADQDDPLEQFTEIHFVDGYVHIATGFSIGYMGEGPRGLVTAIKRYLVREDITVETVSKWLHGINYIILMGQGQGKPIFKEYAVRPRPYGNEIAQVW